MEITKVGYWLQVGANVGILVGLILVGLQIKQSSDITRAEFTNQLWGSANQMALALMGENPSSALRKAQKQPHLLTDEEINIVLQWTWYWHELDSNVEYQRNEGLILIGDEHLNQLWRSRASNVYSHNPVSRKAWQIMKESGLKYDWMQVVDAELARLDQAGFQADEFFDQFRKAAAQGQQ